MKTLINGLCFFMLSLLLVNCGGSSPEPVAEDFLTHLSKKEWMEAQALMTKETAPMMTILQGMAGLADEQIDFPSDFEMIGCEVDGETATCTYTADGKTETLNLKKEEGEWKVALTK